MTDSNQHHTDSAARNAPSASEIQTWLVQQLARELQVSADQIKVDQPILSQGVDSMQIVVIVARLEDWLGFRFPNPPLDEYPTIESLSQFVADLSDRRASAAE